MRVPKVSYRPIALVWRVEVQPEEFWVAFESVLEGWIDADFSVLTRFGADVLCSGFAKALVCDASGRFATTLTGRHVLVHFRNQQAADCVQVPAQNRQLQVTFKADF